MAVVEDLFGFPDPDPTACPDRGIPWAATTIGRVHFRRYVMRAQFFSPLPRGMKRCSDIYFCDGCGRDYESEVTYGAHRVMCLTPVVGEEIYRDEARRFMVTRAFGADEMTAPTVQRMCLFAKLFLDHKETFLDVEGFVFYLLYEFDAEGFHFAGYFSRERQDTSVNNLACIAVLPPYQSTGYGSFLIQLSYELSRREGRCGSPERPITALGRRAYTAAWCSIVAKAVAGPDAEDAKLSIAGIAAATGMVATDVMATLVFLGALRQQRGATVIAVTPELQRWAKKMPRIVLQQAALHV